MGSYFCLGCSFVFVIYYSLILLNIVLSTVKLLILSSIFKIRVLKEIIYLFNFKIDVINIWNIIILVFKVIFLIVFKVGCWNIYIEVKERKLEFCKKKVVV